MSTYNDDISDRLGKIYVETINPLDSETAPVAPGHRKRLDPHPTPISDDNEINVGQLPGAKHSVEVVDEMVNWDYTTCVELSVGEYAFRVYLVPPRKIWEKPEPIRQPVERIRRTWG